MALQTQPAPAPIVSVRGLKVGVIDGLDLDIEPGITTIAGPSGSGKTTLFRALAKMVTPTAGRITYCGRDLADWDAVELRRDIHTIPQQPHIWPSTISANLTMGHVLRREPPPAPTAQARALETVELNLPLDTPANQLSGGEQARLAIARALLTPHRLGLWDEPTAALDRSAAHNLIATIRSWAEADGRSIAIITHDPDLAGTMDHHIELGQPANPQLGQSANPQLGQPAHPQPSQTANPQLGQTTTPQLGQTATPQPSQPANPQGESNA